MMRQIVAVLLGLSLALVVTFAVFLASAEVLEALGDSAAATVCRYLSLAVAIAWIIGQILLLAALGVHVAGIGGSTAPSGPMEAGWSGAEEAGALGPEQDDEEESAIPPRG